MISKKINYIGLFLLITALLLLENCGGSGTTIVGNTSTTTQSEITIGKVTSGSSTITIPLAAFGDSDADVETTTLAITKNGTALTGDFDLPSHYDSTTQIVSLTLTGLASGDILVFEFTHSDASVVTHQGTVSSSASTTASRTGAWTATANITSISSTCLSLGLSSSYDFTLTLTTSSCRYSYDSVGHSFGGNCSEDGNTATATYDNGGVESASNCTYDFSVNTNLELDSSDNLTGDFSGTMSYSGSGCAAADQNTGTCTFSGTIF